VVEDLGGGLKADFMGVALINAVQAQTGNGSTVYNNNSNVFNDEITLGLQGGFGRVRLGTPNAASHEIMSGVMQPFGTAMGSAYMSSGVSRFGATTTTLGINSYFGGASSNGRVVRMEKSVRYDTPVMNGFSGSYVYAAANGKSATNSSNTNGFGELGLRYSQGPLNLAYSSSKVEAGATAAAKGPAFATTATTSGGTTTYATTWTAAASDLTANSSVKYTTMGGNYTIGAATVYYGATTAKGTGVSLDTASSNIAVKYALSKTVDLMANVVKVDDKLAANAAKDQSLTGLGVDYKFSNRTNAYVRYETYKANKADATLDVNATAIGIRHQF